MNGNQRLVLFILHPLPIRSLVTILEPCYNSLESPASKIWGPETGRNAWFDRRRPLPVVPLCGFRRTTAASYERS